MRGNSRTHREQCQAPPSEMHDHLRQANTGFCPHLCPTFGANKTSHWVRSVSCRAEEAGYARTFLNGSFRARLGPLMERSRSCRVSWENRTRVSRVRALIDFLRASFVLPWHCSPRSPEGSDCKRNSLAPFHWRSSAARMAVRGRTPLRNGSFKVSPSGVHLPRIQSWPAFALLVDTLRYRGRTKNILN